MVVVEVQSEEVVVEVEQQLEEEALGGQEEEAAEVNFNSLPVNIYFQGSLEEIYIWNLTLTIEKMLLLPLH